MPWAWRSTERRGSRRICLQKFLKDVRRRASITKKTKGRGRHQRTKLIANPSACYTSLLGPLGSVPGVFLQNGGVQESIPWGVSGVRSSKSPGNTQWDAPSNTPLFKDTLRDTPTLPGPGTLRARQAQEARFRNTHKLYFFCELSAKQVGLCQAKRPD